MKPKEKAIELVEKFIPDAKYWDCYFDEPLTENHAKNCALICVDELIKAFEQLSIEDSGGINRDFGHSYWYDVKKEIEKL